jgi:hypothetical protein
MTPGLLRALDIPLGHGRTSKFQSVLEGKLNNVFSKHDMASHVLSVMPANNERDLNVNGQSNPNR